MCQLPEEVHSLRPDYSSVIRFQHFLTEVVPGRRRTGSVIRGVVEVELTFLKQGETGLLQGAPGCVIVGLRRSDDHVHVRITGKDLRTERGECLRPP